MCWALEGLARLGHALQNWGRSHHTTIDQYLAAGLIDELRLHIVPLTLDAGPRLIEGVPPLKSEQVKSRAATSVTHLTSRVLSELRIIHRF